MFSAGCWAHSPASARVTAGALLQLNGTVTGDVVVEPSAELATNGTVAGDIVAMGSVEIFGVVTGFVREKGGSVVTHPGARVS